jgi:hypothetical protein
MRRRHVIEGSEAILEVYDDKAMVIDANSESRYEYKPSTTLLYSGVSSITLELATRGELGQFIFHVIRTPSQSARDGIENVFTFPLSENALAKEVCAFINKQLQRSDLFISAKSKLAVAMQIKKLSEQLSAGELTFAEFEKEKRKILHRP